MRCVPLHSVGHQDKASINHVPLVPGHLIKIVRNHTMLRNADCLQHRLLPKAATTFHSGNCIHYAKSQDAFNGARDNAKDQSLCVVFIPSLNVKCERSYNIIISKNGQNKAQENLSQPNNVRTVYQLCPRFIAAAKSRTSSTVLQASTP